MKKNPTKKIKLLLYFLAFLILFSAIEAPHFASDIPLVKMVKNYINRLVDDNPIFLIVWMLSLLFACFSVLWWFSPRRKELRLSGWNALRNKYPLRKFRLGHKKIDYAFGTGLFNSTLHMLEAAAVEKGLIIRLTSFSTLGFRSILIPWDDISKITSNSYWTTIRLRQFPELELKIKTSTAIEAGVGKYTKGIPLPTKQKNSNSRRILWATFIFLLLCIGTAIYFRDNAFFIKHVRLAHIYLEWVMTIAIAVMVFGFPIAFKVRKSVLYRSAAMQKLQKRIKTYRQGDSHLKD